MWNTTSCILKRLVSKLYDCTSKVRNVTLGDLCSKYIHGESSSISQINPCSTLYQQWRNWHLISSESVVGQVMTDPYVSINTQWHACKKYLTLDWLSTEMLIEFLPSIDWDVVSVLIQMLLECWMRWWSSGDWVYIEGIVRHLTADTCSTHDPL